MSSGRGRRSSGSFHRRLQLAVALLVSLLVVALGASPAAAHAELSESEPQHASTIADPVDEIRLTFSAAADPVRDRFELRDGNDDLVAIDAIRNDGDTVLVITPSVPLTSGQAQLTWAIRAGDSHPRTGTVSFTVSPSSDGASPAQSPPSITDGEPADPAAASGGSSGDGRTWADHLASISRWVVYAALFLCVGGLAYIAWVHRGSEREGRQLVFYVRRAAVVVLLASVMEWMAQMMAARSGDLWAVFAPDAWTELLGTGFAKGTLLRLAGGGLVLAFLRIDHADHIDDVDHRFWSTELSAASIDRATAGTGSVGVASHPRSTLSRLRVEASPLAFMGAGALVVSEAFIGHTATVSPRAVVLLADAGHLLAGAAWVAGAALLALTLRRRRRGGADLDARLLATRFSVMATWALVGVLVTGIALSWSILRTPSATWSTEFGRLLMVKIALVGVAAAFGARNHRVLVPALAEGDDEPARRFQRSLSIEVALFGAVLLCTALLVVSNPT